MLAEDVEKVEPSYVASMSVTQCSHGGKVWHFLKNLNL